MWSPSVGVEVGDVTVSTSRAKEAETISHDQIVCDFQGEVVCVLVTRQ